MRPPSPLGRERTRGSVHPEVVEMRANRTLRAVATTVLLALALTAGACSTDPPPDPEVEEAEPAEDPTPEAEDTVEVQVFFINDQLGDPCTEVFPRPRPVDADDPLTGALEALLEGPTDEERAEGYGGWFSEETAGMLHTAEVVSGTVMVDLDDLRPVIPNASTSCGSAALLAQLDSTVLDAAEGAAGVLYLIDGEHDVFYEWLQFGPLGMAAGRTDR